MSTDAIDFAQIQAIQAAGLTQASAGCYRGKLRPFHPGAKRAWSYGPTTVSVAKAYQTCNPPTLIVSPGTCQPAPETDQTDVETIAQGVSQGLQAAPMVVVRPAPWNEPDYRGIETPRTRTLVLTTFPVADARTIEVQNALAGYLGTTNYPVAAVLAVPGIPVAVLTHRPEDSYRAYEFSISCPDVQMYYLVQWTVTVNGYLHSGPFSLVEGKARLAVKAKRGDSVSINAILATSDAFAVGMIAKLSGWQFPTLNTVDGTYTKVLRTSPSWPRKGN